MKKPILIAVIVLVAACGFIGYHFG